MALGSLKPPWVGGRKFKNRQRTARQSLAFRLGHALPPSGPRAEGERWCARTLVEPVLTPGARKRAYLRDNGV